MVLALALGLGLEWAWGWRNATVFALLGGLLLAQLVPTGAASCSVQQPPDTDRGAEP